MSRARSDELPRFVGRPLQGRPFYWQRRYTYALICFVFVCWFWYPFGKPSAANSGASINWSNFAYSLWAIDTASACHALLHLEALERLGSKADRVLFYPEHWDTKVDSTKDRDSQLLVLARDKYKAKLHPIKLLTAEGHTDGMGYKGPLEQGFTGHQDHEVTKFMAFSLEYYDRVIALDGDSTLLQSIDELFLLPQTPMAMPRAYWAGPKPWPLSPMLMVIKPSLKELENFKWRMFAGGDDTLVQAHRFDVELVNDRFESSALVLPHRPYALLTGEFRRKVHTHYLGEDGSAWDADAVIKEAKLVHFNDWPLPPPWIMWPTKGLEEVQPDCGGSHVGTCPERRIWKHLYDDFRRRRAEVCRLLSEPAPAWEYVKESSLRNVTEPQKDTPGSTTT